MERHFVDMAKAQHAALIPSKYSQRELFFLILQCQWAPALRLLLKRLLVGAQRAASPTDK